MNNDCLFCKIIAGEIPATKVYEDNDFFCFLDIKPINLGHTLIVPKEHHRNLLDLTPELLAKVGPIIQKMALAVKAGTGAEGINIGWNNEAAAGQLVFHAHLHIMPRFGGDGYVHWQGQDGHSPEEFAAVAEKITKQLTT
jgi:histidine triad (HIT) family protein